MARLIIVLLATICIAGCGPDQRPDDETYDQCLRAKLFHECLEQVKNSGTTPSSLHLDDSSWDSVVDSCGGIAAAQSVRRADRVAPECQPGLNPHRW